MNWRPIITENLISEVMAEEYAAYRAPVRESLIYFLEGLSEARQAEILKDQASLPPAAKSAERMSCLARSCPSLHKLGQTMARDHRLSIDLRNRLQPLESLPPSLPPQSLQEIVTRELGPDSRGIEVLPALAEASVAIVVPFRINRKNDAVHEGVLKILKPGIRERLHEELEMLERTGSYLDERIDEFRIPRINYRETFEQIRTKLLSEARLDLEQRHLAAARDIYSDEPRVLVPELLTLYCRPHITAMERVYGNKVTEQGPSRIAEKDSLAELIISELIVRPVFSMEGRDLFQGDPHPGNLFLTPDDRLAILDWSLAGALTERQHVLLTSIIVGAMTMHTGRIMAALTELSEIHVFDRQALRQIVESAIADIGRGRVPGLTWMTSILDEAVKTAGVRFGTDLLLFRRVVHILSGVIADMGGGAELIDQVLMQKFIGEMISEWPYRWLVPPGSRRFPTRLSNADIAELMFTMPWMWGSSLKR